MYVDWLTWIILYLLPNIPVMAYDDVVIAGIGFLPDNIINLLPPAFSSTIASSDANAGLSANSSGLNSSLSLHDALPI